MATVDAMHVAYILTELKDKVLVVNFDSKVRRLLKNIFIQIETEFIYHFKALHVFSEAINQTEFGMILFMLKTCQKMN